MGRTLNILLVVLVVILGVWIGSHFSGGNQKTYSAPESYTETIEGLDGLQVK